QFLVQMRDYLLLPVPTPIELHDLLFTRRPFVRRHSIKPRREVDTDRRRLAFHFHHESVRCSSCFPTRQVLWAVTAFASSRSKSAGTQRRNRAPLFVRCGALVSSTVTSTCRRFASRTTRRSLTSRAWASRSRPDFNARQGPVEVPNSSAGLTDA